MSAAFKIGSPLNDPSARTDVYSTYSQSLWTGGPTVELHLPLNFSVEFDALFRTYRQNRTYPLRFESNLNTLTGSTVQKTDAWDFPLMLKYRFRVGPIRPFVNAGYFWTRESSEVTSITTCNGPAGSCLPPDLPYPPGAAFFRNTSISRGYVAGAGIEFRTRFVRIAPEVRFNRPTHGGLRENRVTGLVRLTFGRR